MDGAGRVVIPKSVRQSLRLQPGDVLDLDVTTDEITLRPVRDLVSLVKEQCIWVYRTRAPLTDVSPVELIEQMRNERLDDILS